jgi:hypothetical protein
MLQIKKREDMQESKREYKERIEAKLEELEPKIWQVKQKAAEMQNQHKDEYQRVFRVLNTKFEVVVSYLSELESAGGETWKNFKAKVDGALSDLNNSVGNILSRSN